MGPGTAPLRKTGSGIRGGGAARAGVQIISGLAYGIDSAGQRGALKAGGRTFGVLGCGIRSVIRENYGLYERMCRQGGVLSEWMPWGTAAAEEFPHKKPDYQGDLSDVLLVMEARQKSGSLITAGIGLEQGKRNFGTSGRVSDPLSEGRKSG